MKTSFNSAPRASQGNRAFRRKASALTGLKAPRGVQDDAKKVIKLSYVEKKVKCRNEGCTKPRQHGSSRCISCAQRKPVVV